MSHVSPVYANNSCKTPSQHSTDETSNHRENRTTSLFERVFSDAKGLIRSVFKVLSPEDNARAARTSILIHRAVSQTFYKWMKPGMNRDQIKKPISYFMDCLESRELYVMFDERGVEHVDNLIRQKLPNYTLLTKIPLSYTATKIDEFINHIKAQIESYHDGDINDLPEVQRIAIESGRMIHEIKHLSDERISALIKRPDLNIEDVEELSDLQVEILINSKYKLDYIKGLSAADASTLYGRIVGLPYKQLYASFKAQSPTS